MEEETKKCKCCGRELPLSSYGRNGWGTLSVCVECVAKRRKEKREAKRQAHNYEQELAEAKKMRLKDFTPRDLMEELKSRGYIGKILIPQTTYKEVDLSKEF